MGSDVEVLAPEWFREDTAERVKGMWDKYKEDKSTLENHHHALADAEACAWIAREIL